MKPLDIRFSEVQKLQISDLSDTLMVTKSEVARAALLIGMEKIRALAAQNKAKGIEFVKINATKAIN